jgi:hypothetical protein
MFAEGVTSSPTPSASSRSARTGMPVTDAKDLYLSLLAPATACLSQLAALRMRRWAGNAVGP